MQVIHPCCCGLDAHAKTVVACLINHGKRRSGQTTKGSPYLRAALTQAAWAAAHTKGTYLAAQYHRLIRRMGRNKALVAVAHSLLVILYHVLTLGLPMLVVGHPAEGSGRGIDGGARVVRVQHLGAQRFEVWRAQEVPGSPSKGTPRRRAARYRLTRIERREDVQSVER